MEEVYDISKDMKLSEIADKIEYVKLENHEDLLYAYHSVRVLPTDNYLLVSGRGKALALFDYKGKFVRYIGAYGRGPGEYMGSYIFSYNSEDNIIYIQNIIKGSILHYNSNGELLNETKPEYRPLKFEYIDNDTFCAWISPEQKSDTGSFNFIMFDYNGEIKSSFYISTYKFRNAPEGSAKVIPAFYKEGDHVNIQTYQNDTIYSVNPDLITGLPFSWDLGKYDPPFYTLQSGVSRDERSRYMTWFNTIESGKYWFVEYAYESNTHRGLFNKNDGSYFEIEDAIDGIVNDIDGGPGFWPQQDNKFGDIYVNVLDPFKITKDRDDARYENTEFRDISESINENDNPLLMLVYLK